MDPASPSRPAASPSPPAASPSGPRSGFAEAAPNGTTVKDLAGVWTGETLLTAGDATESTTWAMRVTISPCARGDTCGELHIATARAGWSGKPESCDYVIDYLGYRETAADFVFGEKVTGQSGHHCYSMQLLVMPMPSRERVAVQQLFGQDYEDSGILRRLETP